MDPNATLRELLAALRRGEMDHATELADALGAWLDRGGFSPVAIAQTTYQGWKNYETWAVHLSLTGDETSDGHCCRLARHAIAAAAKSVPVVKGCWTIDQARKHLLAELSKISSTAAARWPTRHRFTPISLDPRSAKSIGSRSPSHFSKGG